MKESKIESSVLAEASAIIYGDREQTYGKPSKNLDVIADMWNAYMRNAYMKGRITADDYLLNAKDIAVMMILLKAARLANNQSHRDSVVDICGYAALIERCDD